MCINLLGCRLEFLAQLGMILLLALNYKTYLINVFTNNWKPLTHGSSHFATGSTKSTQQEIVDTFPDKIFWGSISTANRTGRKLFFGNQPEGNTSDRSYYEERSRDSLTLLHFWLHTTSHSTSIIGSPSSLFQSPFSKIHPKT
jgi:hypothetical protein